MSAKDICYKEHEMLREELHGLKSCQITFLTYSVTATGVLLGIASNLVKSSLWGLCFLLPLTILLPSLWVFFDKATTITRIVGYYRHLETAIRQDKMDRILGWENALAKFREMQQMGMLEYPNPHSTLKRIFILLGLAFVKTTHRYWVLILYVFSGLSMLSVLLGFIMSQPLTSASWIVLGLALLLVLVSAFWNAHIVYLLIWGRHSYDANEQFWKTILNSASASFAEK